MQFAEPSFLTALRFRLQRLYALFYEHVWKNPRRRWSTLGGITLFFLVYLFSAAAPFNFPVGSLVKVAGGETVGEIADTLKQERIIRSPLLFKTVVMLFGGEHTVIAGRYLFPRRQNVFGVAWRLIAGDFELEPVRVTIPEGANTREITELLSRALPEFEAATFYSLAEQREGRLFPDTYFFLPGEEPLVIITALQNNFNRQVATLEDEIQSFGRPLDEIVTMASLLEEEAPDMEDRRIIAGILWERIDRGIPLQVDAVFPYIIGKNSFELTREDLKVDSPYNTYLYRGLPKGPITNPGLDSILAAATPTKTNYLYYLSDRDGNLHYSVSYDQHLQAKAKYIDS